MLIFLEKQLVFLATPKTGTTAVEMALKSQADIIFARRRKHIPARRYVSRIAPFLAQTFDRHPETVAVMRDPVEQIRSWYRYRARTDKDGQAQSTKGLCFDDFVLDVIAENPPERAKIGSQFTFLSDRRGRVVVDHLFAYDNQPAFLSFLEERLGNSIVLQQKNVSPRMEAPLSDGVSERLRQARRAEFDLYDRLTAAGGYLQKPG